MTDPEAPGRNQDVEKMRGSRPTSYEQADRIESPACDAAESQVRVLDATKALAFIGDLSMGQPTDHSIRTAWIGAQLAQAMACSDEDVAAAKEVSLLRWSGCTANASGFSELFADDVLGREAMLAMRPNWSAPLDAKGGAAIAMAPLAQIHCEVSGDVAQMVGFGARTEGALRCIFEAYDGTGIPQRLAGEQIPIPVFIASVAGDLEIFSRVYGLSAALELISQKGGRQYPKKLAQCAAHEAPGFLEELAGKSVQELDTALSTAAMSGNVSPDLIADVIDLKLPWMAGYSRAVASNAAACGSRLGLDDRSQALIYRAALIHGIGRAAVPNTLWNMPGSLPASAWEKIRLVPYWTLRAGRQISGLEREAELASFAYERLDGSGYFRGATGQVIPLEAQIVAVALAWVALRSSRPWRPAMAAEAAEAVLIEQAGRGGFDTNIVRMMCSSTASDRPVSPQKKPQPRLSDREIEILRSISRGASNKEVARTLGLSPSTVRTHVESIFRKLACSTRAAATLKASSMGLLSE